MKRKKKRLLDIEEEPIDALSYEELQMLRTQQGKSEDRSQLPPHDQSDKANFRRLIKKNKLVTAAISVVAIALLVGIGFGFFGLITLWQNRPNTSDFTFELGEEKPYTVVYEELVRDDVLYVDLRSLAPFADLIVTGTAKEMQFTAKSGTFLRFEHGSEYARINGKRVEMTVSEFRGEKEKSAKAILSADACYVPYQFLKETVIDGMEFRLDSKENVLSFRRILTDEVDKQDEPISAVLLFDVGEFPILPEEGVIEREYSYMIDIEPYLESITVENLLLANKEHPLGADFRPMLEQITVKTANKRIFYLNADAAKALEAMMKEMEAAGVSDIMVTSAYRAYSRQEELFARYCKEEKQKHPDWSEEEVIAEVLTYSARPGTSEHQTGLCVDFITSKMRELNNEFEESEAFDWLKDNAHKFGFILRYDKDKVDLTGYSYESWHYRFVGREAATEIYEKGLCLEEYLKIAKR